jgi:predicted nucleic acid-binding protein
MSLHSIAEVYAALTRLPVQPRIHPGAKIYDALLLRCAARCAVERIYTFNLGDFKQLAPAGLEEKICVP